MPWLILILMSTFVFTEHKLLMLVPLRYRWYFTDVPSRQLCTKPAKKPATLSSGTKAFKVKIEQFVAVVKNKPGYFTLYCREPH